VAAKVSISLCNLEKNSSDQPLKKPIQREQVGFICFSYIMKKIPFLMG